MLFASDVVLSGGWDRGFSGIDIQTVLTLLGETYGEGDYVVVGDRMRYILGQALLLNTVLVQGRHEVRQRPRHAELNLQLAPGEHQSFLKSIDRAIVNRPPDRFDKIGRFLFLGNLSWLFFFSTWYFHTWEKRAERKFILVELIVDQNITKLLSYIKHICNKVT